MEVQFRKINSKEAYFQTVEFMKSDVRKNGGTCAETVDMWGMFVSLIVSSNKALDGLKVVEAEPILIWEEITRLEAIDRQWDFE